MRMNQKTLLGKRTVKKKKKQVGKQHLFNNFFRNIQLFACPEKMYKPFRSFSGTGQSIAEQSYLSYTMKHNTQKPIHQLVLWDFHLSLK